MTQNKPEWITEAETRQPEYILLSDSETWINLFRWQAHELAAPMQANGKRAKAHMLSDEDWTRVAQQCEAIWSERGYAHYI